MAGPVLRRLRLRARYGRAAAAAGVLAAGLLSAGMVTASAGSAPLADACTLDLLGNCVVGSSGTAPTPTPSSSGLCILVLCNSGSTTGTSSPTPTPTCTLPACLPVSPNPTCDITTDPTCLLGSATPTACQTNCSPPGHPGTLPPGTSSPGGTRQAQPSGTLFGGAGGLGADSGTPPPNGTAVNGGLNVAAVPVVQTLSPVSGLAFGHAPILWPLFGALDVLGLVAAYYVVRRTRATRTD